MLFAKNKNALFNYELVDTFLAGVVLYGYEVKAVREGHVSFKGAYVSFLENVPVILNLYIGPYSKQSQEIAETETKRPRKLLLNAYEIRRIREYIDIKGNSAVPLSLLLKKGLLKCEVGIVKGLKKHEKKHIAKERQIEKDLNITKKELLRK